MATDQQAFDNALASFLTDIDDGLQAIKSKIETEAPQVDLSNELQSITDSRGRFDSAVSEITGPPPTA